MYVEVRLGTGQGRSRSRTGAKNLLSFQVWLEIFFHTENSLRTDNFIISKANNTNFQKGQYSPDRKAQGINYALQPELYPRAGMSKYRSLRQNAGFNDLG